MCDPVIGGTILSGFGMGMDIYAGYQANSFNEDVAKTNAKIERQQADDAKRRGMAEEMRNRTKVNVLKGEQRAQAAANGVIVDTGSSLDILEDTAAAGELDALTIRSNAAREAYGHEVSARDYDAKASMHGFKKKSELIGSVASMGGSFLSGGGG